MDLEILDIIATVRIGDVLKHDQVTNCKCLALFELESSRYPWLLIEEIFRVIENEFLCIGIRENELRYKIRLSKWIQ